MTPEQQKLSRIRELVFLSMFLKFSQEEKDEVFTALNLLLNGFQ